MRETVIETSLCIWILATGGLAVFCLLRSIAELGGGKHRKRVALRSAAFLATAFSCFFLNPMTNLMSLGYLYQVQVNRMAEYRGSTAELISTHGPPLKNFSYQGKRFWSYVPHPWYIILPVGTITYEIDRGAVVNADVDY